VTATLSPTNQLQFEKAVRVGIDTLNRHYGTNVPYPRVRWSLTGAGRLGTVVSTQDRWTGVISTSYIALHTGFAHQLGARYLDTVLHEVCHVVTNARCSDLNGGRREGRWSSHGREWANAMRVLGLAPDRLATGIPADVVAAASSTRKVIVSCACRSYPVTSQKATKVTRPGVLCATCRQPFRRNP